MMVIATPMAIFGLFPRKVNDFLFQLFGFRYDLLFQSIRFVFRHGPAPLIIGCERTERILAQSWPLDGPIPSVSPFEDTEDRNVQAEK